MLTAFVEEEATDFLDSVLKYLSIISVSGAAISFVVGLLKYLDQRNREEKYKRDEKFHALLELISGNAGLKDSKISFTRQLASIYQLQNFSEYRDIIMPVLQYLKKDFQRGKDDERLDFARDAVDATLLQIEHNKH